MTRIEEEQLKLFIELNIKLIDKDDWDQVYSNLTDAFDASICTFPKHELLDLMLGAEIDPTPYLSYIPAYYAAKSTSLAVANINPQCKRLGNSSFNTCVKLEQVNFRGNNLKVIGRKAFYDCINAKFSALPGSLEWIERSAFAGCNSITSIILPDSLKNIDIWAFASCNNLTYVKLPLTLKHVGQKLFDSCHSLKEIDYPGTKDELVKNYFEAILTLNSELLHKPTFLRYSHVEKINCSDGPFIITEEMRS